MYQENLDKVWHFLVSAVLVPFSFLVITATIHLVRRVNDPRTSGGSTPVGGDLRLWFHCNWRIWKHDQDREETLDEVESGEEGSTPDSVAIRSRRGRSSATRVRVTAGNTDDNSKDWWSLDLRLCLAAIIAFLIGIVKEVFDLLSNTNGVRLPWCNPTCNFEWLDIMVNINGVLFGVLLVIGAHLTHRFLTKPSVSSDETAAMSLEPEDDDISEHENIYEANNALCCRTMDSDSPLPGDIEYGVPAPVMEEEPGS